MKTVKSQQAHQARWFGERWRNLGGVRGLLVVLLLLGALPVSGRAQEGVSQLRKQPFFQQLEPVLGRGVNLGNALEAPSEGEWGVVLEEEYFELIKDAGFEVVRIPVRWSAHAGDAAPYGIDTKFMNRVGWAIRQALDHDLKVVVNMHHYEEIMEDPDGHRDRFLGMWEQIAKHFQDLPQTVVFELLNEPHDQLTAEKWNRLLVDGIRTVRRSNPKRQIMVGPVQWNNVNALPTLKLPEDDRNLIVTFHYYLPFHFTHQGAGWVGDQSDEWLGMKWTGSSEEKDAVRTDLDKAIRWAAKRRRPLFLGEFGAYEKADMASRARWTRFVAEEAMKRKIGFAYWEFCSGFGIYDADQGTWKKPLRDALLQ